MSTNGHTSNGVTSAHSSKPFLTAQEMAHDLGVSLRTLDTWVSLGLPVIQPAGKKGKRLFRREHVYEWLASRETANQQR